MPVGYSRSRPRAEGHHRDPREHPVDHVARCAVELAGANVTRAGECEVEQ